jgi:hypothetical protein
VETRSNGADGSMASKSWLIVHRILGSISVTRAGVKARAVGMRSGAATPAGFGCGRIHCGTGLATSKIEIHYPRQIRIDADLLLIVVRIHAGEPNTL